MVAVGIRLVCRTMYIFFLEPVLAAEDSFLSRNVLQVTVSDSRIIRNSSSGVEGLAVFQENGKHLYLQDNLKVMEKNSKYMSSKMCNFSTMQYTRMQCELYEGLHESQATKASAL